MIVENQKNIKVHLATTEIISQGISAIAGGSNYGLGTAFPMVYNAMKTGKFKNDKLISRMSSNFEHYILDSGLFTLMFGSHKGKKDEAYLDRWYECLTDYVLHEEYNGTMVEVDCQKVLGVEKAWEYRKKMKEKVSNRIINVFHIEDGQKGLDRLIEYSDYIALSVPELRFINKKEYLYRLANYIKNKKPNIDIHLLGFTEKTNLEKMSFCTTCDSSSWISGIRYGQVETIKGKGHIDNIKKSIINENLNKWLDVRNKNFHDFNLPKDMNRTGILTFSAKQSLKIYNKYAGSQD